MFIMDKYPPKLGGRPSKYKKSFNNLIMQMAAEGYSVVQFAAHVGVARSTVYKWKEDESSGFSDAFDRARDIAEAYWESKWDKDMRFGGKDVKDGMWRQKMYVRFGWGVKQESDTDQDGDIVLTISSAKRPE